MPLGVLLRRAHIQHHHLVRLLAEGHKARARLGDAAPGVVVERPRTVHGNPFDAHPATLREHLPRHDVRVTVVLGHGHDIPGAQPAVGPAEGGQVQRLRGPMGEDEPIRAFHAEEAGQTLAGALVSIGRLLGQGMGTPMDVRSARAQKTSRRR